jgi:hypothetical protein
MDIPGKGRDALGLLCAGDSRSGSGGGLKSV